MTSIKKWRELSVFSASASNGVYKIVCSCFEMVL
jgi:hypothetical protein